MEKKGNVSKIMTESESDEYEDTTCIIETETDCGLSTKHVILI